MTGGALIMSARTSHASAARRLAAILFSVRVLLHRRLCLSQRSLYVLHNVAVDKGSISQIFHTLAYYYYFVKSRQDFLWNFGVDFWGHERNRDFRAVCGLGCVRKNQSLQRRINRAAVMNCVGEVL